MDVHEYQAKELLAQFGVPVPKGAVAFSPDQAVYAATELGGWNWVPMEALPPREEYVATYRSGEDYCPTIEMNGQQYELVTWRHDVAASGQLLDLDGQVILRPGDQVRIDGQIWPDQDTMGCLPLKLLAWELESLP